MKKNLGAVVVVTCLIVWASSASAMRVEDVSNPRSSGLWVSDHAQMINAETEARLNQLLEKAYQDLTVEIAVVTVETVDLPTPKDFATALFEHWGIGHKSTDNGLLILMVKDSRRLEMETGYGLEAVLPDGWLKRMQEAEMVPHFRQGDFGQGLSRGAELTIEKVSTQRHTVKATYEPAPQESGFLPKDIPLSRLILYGLPIAFGGFFLLIFFNIIFGSRRRLSQSSISSDSDFWTQEKEPTEEDDDTRLTPHVPVTNPPASFGHEWPKHSGGILSSNDKKSDDEGSNNKSGGSFGDGSSGGGGAGSSW